VIFSFMYVILLPVDGHSNRLKHVAETYGNLLQSYQVHFSEQTRQAMNVENINEAYSCNHCCNAKAKSTTYYEFVLVALSIQHALHMRHIVICGLSHTTIFFHIIIIHEMTFKKSS